VGRTTVAESGGRVVSDIQLVHGDCLEVMKDFDDGQFDAVVTDPPYGHNNNSGEDLISVWERALGTGNYVAERDDRPIENDGPEANELFQAVLPEINRILVPGGCYCCCGGGGGPDPQFARWSLWMDEVLNFKQMVIWDKGPMGMGWHYRRSYETVLVANKNGAKCKWHDGTKRVENIIRPGAYGIKKIIPNKDQHPTQKPVNLMAHFIQLHTEPGDTVLDPFMGSGTTGVACVKTGRNFVGIDIDKNYYDIACRRVAEAQAQPRLL